jgi:hypothetical protein
VVRRHNREVGSDAALKASLGIVFSLITYGFLFWFGWVVGFFMAGSLNLHPWQFAAIFAGIFLIVATWSAWVRVNPLAGLEPLSDQQRLLTLISLASPNIVYFSPRHATAGAAVVLLGGPAAVIEAIGIWAHRIRTKGALMEDAACLLGSCQTAFPVEQIRHPAAALVLRRLHLIKVVPHGNSAALALTDKGFAVLSGGKAKKGKPARRTPPPR